MNILFIVTGSIAVSKCFEILNELKKNKIRVSCIITNNAKKLLNTNKYISNIDLDLFSIVDSSDEVVEILNKFYDKKGFKPNF